MNRLVAFILVSLFAATVWSAPASAATQTTDGPIYQLRIYGLFDETREAFHERFRDHGARIMRRHGFEIEAMWEARNGERPEFVYLLKWPDEATMRAAWARFMADEEWSEIKRVTAAEHGRLMEGIEDRVIRLTDYSPALR